MNVERGKNAKFRATIGGAARFIAPVVMGAIGGMAIVVMAGSKKSSSETANASPHVPEEPQVPAVERPPPSSGEKSWDERRVSGIEQSVASLRHGASGHERDAPLPPPRLSPKEQAAEDRREFQSLLQAHSEEAVDPSWSPRANESFDGELQSMGSHNGFTVEAVDCRRTSCTATIGWKSFTQARATKNTILYKHYGINCGVTVHLPEPDPNRAVDSEYRSIVLFDCEEARNGE